MTPTILSAVTQSPLLCQPQRSAAPKHRGTARQGLLRFGKQTSWTPMFQDSNHAPASSRNIGIFTCLKVAKASPIVGVHNMLMFQSHKSNIT